jgi:hypothetical protein
MKTYPALKRKHGLKAHLQKLPQAIPTAAHRPIVSLLCENHGQAYVWMTDRGRSRLIKH